MRAWYTGTVRLTRTTWGRVGRGVAFGMVLAALLAGCNASGDEASSSAAGNANQETAYSQEQAGEAKSSGDAAPAADNQANPAAQAEGDQGGGGTAAGGAPPAEAAEFSRKIIYTANLVMQVENYAEAEPRVQEVIRQSGGYILQFNENTSAAEKSGTFTIKVPASGFQSFIDLLEQIHPTVQKKMQGQDVTEEYVDLSARLKAKLVMESRLVAFMEKAEKTDELVAFSTELGKVQEEIERIKGRMRYLEQNVSYSTVVLRLSEKIGSADVITARDRGPLFGRAADALRGTLAVLGFLLQGIVVMIAGALPVLLLLALAAIPYHHMRKRRKAKLEEIRSRLSEQKQTQESKNE